MVRRRKKCVLDLGDSIAVWFLALPRHHAAIEGKPGVVRARESDRDRREEPRDGALTRPLIMDML
jgi:hypothetical protein